MDAVAIVRAGRMGHDEGAPERSCGIVEVTRRRCRSCAARCEESDQEPPRVTGGHESRMNRCARLRQRRMVRSHDAATAVVARASVVMP